MAGRAKNTANARRTGAPGSKARTSAIPGVVITPLQCHDDPRGWLVELFRSDELPKGNVPAMAYVSATQPGKSRGPHEHRRQTDIFCFLGPGNFQVCLWDNRKRSRTYGCRETFVFGVLHPCRLVIPPGVVHGYKNISNVEAVCFNAPNKLYRGKGKKNTVDEIRHEDDPHTPFRMD